MSRTAIFGGTFNPFHIGHYKMLEALQNDTSIDEIFLMPDKLPPHKVCDYLADDNIRIEMCKIAAKDFQKAKLCLIEFERKGKSYTYDTILELKKLYPQKEFVFTFGGDMLVTFDLWYNYNELMKMLSFIAFRRRDTDNSVFDEKVEYFKKKGMKIKVKDEIIPAVASSEIRSDFKNAQNLIPNKIFEFLKERGVYNE